MRTEWRPLAIALSLSFSLLQNAGATSVPRLSFEQLTDSSELVVAGRITNSWAAWDVEHKYIWTHYTMTVESTLKGAQSRTVEFAEPGGAIGKSVMTIAGSVRYAVGDNMMVFLARMPNGYLRTTGWSQGQYAVDARGRVHGQATLGLEIMTAGANVGHRLTTLEGMSVSDLGRLIANRVQGSVK